MKKIILSLTFLLLTPLFSLSTIALTQPQNQAAQTLNLNSQTFGFYGPLSISTTYSRLYGIIFNGRYTQAIGRDNAFSLLLQGGAKQRRANITWDYLINKNQRVKLSIERLWQRMTFNFTSGNLQQWMAQNAYGGDYEYRLNKGWLNDINLGAYYSDANSKNLSPIIYNNQGVFYENLRHIAGGTDKVIDAGVDLIPTDKTKIGLKINYENLHFDTRYNHSNENDEGLGFSITLQQILTKHIQLKLLANDQQSSDRYGATLAFLLPSPHGSSLELDLNTQHNIGHDELPNDNTYGIGLDYRWGLGNNDQDQFTIDRDFNSTTLVNWAKTPAVDMPQVLAIKDEKVITLHTSSVTKQPILSAKLKTYAIYVHANEHVNISLQPYLPTKTMAKPPLIKVSGLPQGWQYSQKTGDITAHIGKKLTLKNKTPFYVTVKNNSAGEPSSLYTFIFIISVNPQTGQPLWKANPEDQYYIVDDKIDPIHLNNSFSKPIDSGIITFNDNDAQSISVKKDPSGATQTLIASALGQHGITLSNNTLKGNITGDQSLGGEYVISFKAKNNDGFAVKAASFKLTVEVPPSRNSVQTQDQTNILGTPITAVNLANYYVSPLGSGEIYFDESYQPSIDITAPNGTHSTLSNSPLYDNGQGIHLSGNTLDGSIPLDIATGDYTITFDAENNVEFSDTPAKFILHIKASGAVTLTCPQLQAINIQGKNISATVMASNGSLYTFSGKCNIKGGCQGPSFWATILESDKTNGMQCNYKIKTGGFFSLSPDKNISSKAHFGNDKRGLCLKGIDQCAAHWPEDK